MPSNWITVGFETSLAELLACDLTVNTLNVGLLAGLHLHPVSPYCVCLSQQILLFQVLFNNHDLEYRRNYFMDFRYFCGILPCL
jgi:hypothetical protein